MIKKEKNKKIIDEIVTKYLRFSKTWYSDFKKPETIFEALAFFDFVTSHGDAPQWSLQYYGYGEHLTFWSGFGGFTDFNVDNGTAIDWSRLKEIIVESAQDLYDDLKEYKPHLFKSSPHDLIKKGKK